MIKKKLLTTLLASTVLVVSASGTAMASSPNGTSGPLNNLSDLMKKQNYSIPLNNVVNANINKDCLNKYQNIIEFLNCEENGNITIPGFDQIVKPEKPTVPGKPTLPDRPSRPDRPNQPDTDLPDIEVPDTEAPDANKPGNDSGSDSGNKPGESIPNASFQGQVLKLVNEERAKAGIKPLTLNNKLSGVAQLKSEDMAKNNYFSHNSPTYGTPFEMMTSQGISYTTAGENIASGQTSPESVMNAWMNSQGHRENILNENFTDLGVGYVKSNSGTTYWTQMFIK